MMNEVINFEKTITPGGTQDTEAMKRNRHELAEGVRDVRCLEYRTPNADETALVRLLVDPKAEARSVEVYENGAKNLYFEHRKQKGFIRIRHEDKEATVPSV